MKIRGQKELHHTPGKSNRVSIFLGVIIFALLLVQVIVSNTLSTTGEVISKVDREISDLKDQNNDMREKIASYSALTTIESKAKELGLSKRIAPQYISPELPVALNLH